MKTPTTFKSALCVMFFAGAWSSASQALLIDSFDTTVSVNNFLSAASTEFAVTSDSGAGMIGDRTLTVDVTVGGGPGADGAFATVNGVLLSLANGPATNSVVTTAWDFAATDLTEGGTQTGIFLTVPDPIDKDLSVGLSINGGAFSSILFPGGASGDAFFFPFTSFANGADAVSATSLAVQFSSPDVAWDARVNFIETGRPSW